MATFCKKCLQPIQWKQNNNDRWIPMEMKGDRYHNDVCRGEPVKGTKQDLKIRLVELEEELEKTKKDLKNYRSGYQRLEVEVRRERLISHTQKVINTAVAWYRARKKRKGKTDDRFLALKKAIDDYCEIEKK